ncbi:MAG: GNAT family N-acetyltransferase [Chloroflexota bacterium]
MTDRRHVREYGPEDRRAWDDFVRSGKCSSFLHERGYMEYHRERFRDASLVVLDGDQLIAVMPANQVDSKSVDSHGGLTYGGLVVRRGADFAEVVEIFGQLLEYLASKGVTDLRYRRIPTFYEAVPNDEIAHCAFVLEALRPRMAAGVVIALSDRLPYDSRRARNLRRARRGGLRIIEGDLATFWKEVLEPRLASRHGATPVHSLGEIEQLAHSFPDNIRQYTVLHDGRAVAGATIYETPLVARAQYIAGTDEGLRGAALDFLFAWLLEERYTTKRYFDLGTSNTSDGQISGGLLAWKEGFGGRVYVQDFYDFKTSGSAALAGSIA